MRLWQITFTKKLPNNLFPVQEKHRKQQIIIIPNMQLLTISQNTLY